MEVRQQFGADVQIIGVPGLSSDIESMRSFIADTGTDEFPHILDGGEIWQQFGVSEQRTYVYVNDDGEWRTSGYGSLASDVEGLISQ